MREIEIKARLRNPEETEARLRDLGCELGNMIVQDDTVYVEKVGSVKEFLDNDNFLRIRLAGEDIIFTLKYHKERWASPESMPFEHEVKVDSEEELKAMIALLGFQEALRIRKTRRVGHCNGYEVCFDDVDELGSFIELEKLADHDADVEPVKEDMMNFLYSLGIQEEDLLVPRYDIQLLEKRFSNA